VQGGQYFAEAVRGGVEALEEGDYGLIYEWEYYLGVCGVRLWNVWLLNVEFVGLKLFMSDYEIMRVDLCCSFLIGSY